MRAVTHPMPVSSLAHGGTSGRDDDRLRDRPQPPDHHPGTAPQPRRRPVRAARARPRSRRAARARRADGDLVPLRRPPRLLGPQPAGRRLGRRGRVLLPVRVPDHRAAAGRAADARAAVAAGVLGPAGLPAAARAGADARRLGARAARASTTTRWLATTPSGDGHAAGSSTSGRRWATWLRRCSTSPTGTSSPAARRRRWGTCGRSRSRSSSTWSGRSLLRRPARAGGSRALRRGRRP